MYILERVADGEELRLANRTIGRLMDVMEALGMLAGPEDAPPEQVALEETYDGIPRFKLGYANEWFVKPEEIRAALDARAAAGLDDARAVEGVNISVEGWGRFVAFLEGAAEQGFVVH